MDSPPRIYLDNAATTPLDPSVLQAMMPFLTQEFGNAASQHPFGRRASDAVEEARSEIAALVGGEAQEIFFCKRRDREHQSGAEGRDGL